MSNNKPIADWEAEGNTKYFGEQHYEQRFGYKQ
jgi:hypothetical protein